MFSIAPNYPNPAFLWITNVILRMQLDTFAKLARSLIDKLIMEA